MRSVFVSSLLTMCLASPSMLLAEAAELVVDADFPNGSGTIVELDRSASRIRITPSQHENRGWACWWYVRVRGLVPGQTLTLEVGPAPWATPNRAYYSHDNETWRTTAIGKRSGGWIAYQHQATSGECWFAWCPPFTDQHAARLVDWAGQQCDSAESFTLCSTREKRGVPALRIGEADPQNAKQGIWIQARQHAWETGSSWVCRGLVEWLVSDDPRAVRVRSETTTTIVPVMDIDNVVRGAGGKNQVPHDHNRDWSDSPHWQSVDAAIREIREFDQRGCFDLFVDLHNPGANATEPFYYVVPRKLLSEKGRRNLDRFLLASQIEISGPLKFTGNTRESGPEYDRHWRRISKNWVAFNTSEHVVSVTLETAWNTDHSTADGYREVGRQLGLAVERYLRFDPRED